MLIQCSLETGASINDTEPVAAMVIGDMNIIKLSRNVMEKKAEINELIKMLS
jgi:hypothetical protein